MRPFLVYAVGGAVTGYVFLSFHWALAAVILFGPMMAVVLWHRPEYGLYLFFVLVVMLTDAVPKIAQGTAIFAIQDLDVGRGLPPLVTVFLLALTLMYFFKRYLVEHKESVIAIRHGFVLMVVLLVATGTGLSWGWDAMDMRVEFISVILAAFCFYLSVNVLDTHQKVYQMLSIIFVVAVVKASILDVYYLSGNGWPYTDKVAGFSRIVTQDSTDLMVFVAMTITMYSVSRSKILTGWSRAFGLVGCVPMLFAIIFSFRRSIWLGMIASLLLFYVLSSPSERRRTRVWVWVGTVMLALFVPFAGNLLKTQAFYPVMQRALSITNPGESSNKYHLLESQQALKDIFLHPILGLGLGSHHTPVYGIRWTPQDQPTQIVHNTYVVIWMKFGLLGLSLFIWMAVKYISVVVAYSKTSVSEHPRAIVLGIASLLGIWSVMLFAGSALNVRYELFTIGLFAAMALSLIRNEKREIAKRTRNALHITSR